MLYQTLPNFLGAGFRDRLLEHAFANADRFEATFVGVNREVRPAARKSKKLTDLGALRDELESKVLASIPELLEQLKLTPFEPTGCETELVMHEDGAFYHRHIDSFTGGQRQNVSNDRLLSLVYYFFREPKGFTGGELRVFSLPRVSQDEPEYVDVVPENDCAVVFSSWVPHEVRPIHCPSGDFRDARFAINCWVLRSHE